MANVRNRRIEACNVNKLGIFEFLKIVCSTVFSSVVGYSVFLYLHLKGTPQDKFFWSCSFFFFFFDTAVSKHPHESEFSRVLGSRL